MKFNLFASKSGKKERDVFKRISKATLTAMDDLEEASLKWLIGWNMIMTVTGFRYHMQTLIEIKMASAAYLSEQTEENKHHLMLAMETLDTPKCKTCFNWINEGDEMAWRYNPEDKVYALCGQCVDNEGLIK